MLCRIIHAKIGWVLEIDPARVERDESGTLFVRMATMEPAFLMTNLAEKFRSDSFQQETLPRHAQPDAD